MVRFTSDAICLLDRGIRLFQMIKLLPPPKPLESWAQQELKSTRYPSVRCHAWWTQSSQMRDQTISKTVSIPKTSLYPNLKSHSEGTLGHVASVVWSALLFQGISSGRKGCARLTKRLGQYIEWTALLHWVLWIDCDESLIRSIGWWMHRLDWDLQLFHQWGQWEFELQQAIWC